MQVTAAPHLLLCVSQLAHVVGQRLLLRIHRTIHKASAEPTSRHLGQLLAGSLEQSTDLPRVHSMAVRDHRGRVAHDGHALAEFERAERLLGVFRLLSNIDDHRRARLAAE